MNQGIRLKTGKIFKKSLIFIFWIVLWQFVSMAVNKKFIFASPLSTLDALARLSVHIEFWHTIATSFLRITAGFFLAFVSGLFLGLLSFIKPWLHELLSPIVSLMKSIPVASFIIIALVWLQSNYLATFIAFTIAFPMIYLNTMGGLKSASPELLEMAKIFRFSYAAKLFYIYMPAWSKYIINALQIALGMCWKAGIAAEVIAVPDFSIGEALYMSKIYLNTSELFAWTIVILVVSALFEQIFIRLFKWLLRLEGKGI